MTMQTGMNLDEFLGHSSRAKGGGKVLRWRNREPPQIDTVLHTRSSIVALWGHGWPRLVELERDGEKSVEVWGGTFNCWEPEEILKSQYKRNPDGSRQRPPTVCPLCLLLEHLREQVRIGKLSWVEPVFRFEGDDPSKANELTVGGLYNAFSADDLTRQQLQEMRAAGISQRDAWKQNSNAKCSYVFSIVDYEDVEKGTQTAVETTSLGDAVKRVIRDQIESLGAAEGHPFKNPYVIRWQYREQEKRFDEKYRALAMPKLAITPEIRDLIFDSPAPDLTGIIARGNVASLRSVMEQRALIELPFDRLFARAEELEQAPPEQAEVGRSERAATGKAPAGKPAQKATDARKVAPADAEAAKAAQAPARRRAAPPPPPPEKKQPAYPSGTVTLPCEAPGCGAAMAETDTECWKCGMRYELEDVPAPAPVKAAPRAGAKEKGPGAPAGNPDSDSASDGPWPGEGEDSEVGF